MVNNKTAPGHLARRQQPQMTNNKRLTGLFARISAVEVQPSVRLTRWTPLSIHPGIIFVFLIQRTLRRSAHVTALTNTFLWTYTLVALNTVGLEHV